MPTEQREGNEMRGTRLGGASADFVASLGRKVSDARDVLRALEDEPSASRPRDELRRKLHALGAGARLLRFEAMAQALAQAEAVLERGGKQKGLRKEDLEFLAQTLEDLPALAWGEMPSREPPRATEDTNSSSPPPPQAVQPMPFAALVVGESALAEPLTGESVAGSRAYECERTEDAQAAIDLARAYAPDVVIVDADVEAASELIEALLDDPLTEPVPLVVVGTFSSETASRFVALGVAKLLPKPVSPENLRRACEEVLDQREGRTMRITLGEPTLEQLGNRLAEEIKRALVDSVDRPARSVRVPLGEGTEVLGAVWGAIARVQEVITQKTDGAVRFGGGAPEGAIALAPWLHHELPGSDRMRGRGRGAAEDVRLDRRRVVVADDDPGVTWFIADLLRTAGCEVHEALDGESALEMAFKVSPELVVSDILMPGLDGFALCRALKRDVALRDVPVILLSWKEDLLQRVRELGASAAAYLKKESDARAILARVREVIRPRARIERRLFGRDEVRGRLDGLTVRLLLELTCSLRPDKTRLAVRDASFLYEVEIRNGAPRRATCTAPDGSFERGERVLARMLGASAGRFVVSASEEPIKDELHGTLAQQLARPIAQARGALWVTTGARTTNVESIALDEGTLAEYLVATPEPARTMIERIARGASPRQMLMSGEVSPSLLEDVLADLAARGAVLAVHGPNGADLLKPAVDHAYAILEGRAPVRRSTLPPPRPSAQPVPSKPRVTDSLAEEIARIARSTGRTATPPPAAPVEARAVPAVEAPQYETFTLSDAPPPPAASTGSTEPPSSLEDAVIRELSERSPAAVPNEPQPMQSSDRPPIVEPSELRPRSSNPPAPTRNDEAARAIAAIPSLPPDAVVPGAEEAFAAPPPPPPVPREQPPIMEAQRAILELSERTEVDAATAPTEDVRPDPRGLSLPMRRELSMPAFVSKETEEKIARGEAPSASESIPQEPQRTPLSAAVKVKPEAARGAKKGGAGGWALFLAALIMVGLLVGMALRWTASPVQGHAPAATTTTSAATVAPPAAPSAATPKPTASTPPAPAPSPDDGTFGDLPAGVEVPNGQGYLQLAAPNDARILIDGAQRGRGPKLGIALTSGFHDLRVGPPNREKAKMIEIRAGKTTTLEVQ